VRAVQAATPPVAGSMHILRAAHVRVQPSESTRGAIAVMMYGSVKAFQVSLGRVFFFAKIWFELITLWHRMRV
jgi:hypothetical protein